MRSAAYASSSSSTSTRIDAMSRLKRARRAYKVTKTPDQTTVVMNDEQRINICRNNLARIEASLRHSPDSWRDNVPMAMSTIAILDTTTFMQRPGEISEQIRIVEVLQQLTFSDTYSSNIAEITSWCSRQWLSLQQREPQNVAVLTGIAQTWLSRAQPLLARIHRAENSSSSSGDSSQRSAVGLENDAGDSRPRSSRSVATMRDGDAERRTDTADYVEARAFLQPATEYLDRAVNVATVQGLLTGELLAKAAEAYMSLGNTSHPRQSELHFRRAVWLLRMAAALPAYSLSEYFQQYLDDYGRLID